MANSFTNILDKILAQGLLAFRKEARLPMLVNGDYSMDAADFGDTIDVPVPVPQVVSNVTPGQVPPAPASNTPTKVQIPLNQWKYTDFHMTDKELKEVQKNRHFLPMQVSEAAEALASEVNGYIRTQAAELSGSLAAPGSGRPFSTTANAGTTIASLIQVMGDNRIPKTNRRVLLDPTNEGDAVALDWFRAADQAGTDQVIREAVLGHRFGMDWAADQQAGASFTAGTGAGYLVNNVAGYARGATTIAADTGTGTIVVGDTVKFAGHGAHYRVTTALGGGSFVIGGRGLLEAVADNEAITVIGAGGGAKTEILAFHRNAIAFANRPLTSDSDIMPRNLGSIIRTMQDPQSGLVFRVEVTRQHKQTAWTFDILFGAKTVIPEYGVRIRY